LRGHVKAQLPPELQVLRVTVAGSQAAYDPLLLAMQNALRTQAGATVPDSGEVPLLTLSGERFDSQVLSVGATGRVSEYLLKYELSFRLTDAAGQELAALQTIRLQRDYRFDPLNVLAKEREEQELKRDLQRDGVQQILRRLARTNLKPPAAREGADGASCAAPLASIPAAKPQAVHPWTAALASIPAATHSDEFSIYSLTLIA
jgi:LPS-assembly lipoprotein